MNRFIDFILENLFSSLIGFAIILAGATYLIYLSKGYGASGLGTRFLPSLYMRVGKKKNYGAKMLLLIYAIFFIVVGALVAIFGSQLFSGKQGRYL